MATEETRFASLPKDDAYGAAILGVARPPAVEDLTRWGGLTKNSILPLDNYDVDRYKQILSSDRLNPAEKAAYVAGRAARDLLTDGTRTIIWAGNHPAAQAGFLGSMASTAADLQPDYSKEKRDLALAGEHYNVDHADSEYAAREGFTFMGEGRAQGRMIPLEVARVALPALAATALQQASGNHNWLDPLGGGRTPGFKPVFASEADPTTTDNPIAELAVRYLFGRTGRLLPWDEFTQERPEVSPGDYQRYRAHQFDGGWADLGLFKSTSRNLEGEPEYTLMGFRVPLSAASASTGSLVGGILGSKIAAKAIGDAVAAKGIDAIPKALRPAAQAVGLDRYSGPRRLAGALLGGIGGAVAGYGGAKAANEVVLQPLMNPGPQAQQQAWIQQQRMLGAL